MTRLADRSALASAAAKLEQAMELLGISPEPEPEPEPAIPEQQEIERLLREAAAGLRQILEGRP